MVGVGLVINLIQRSGNDRATKGQDKLSSQPQLTGKLHAHEGVAREGQGAHHTSLAVMATSNPGEMQDGLAENKR